MRAMTSVLRCPLTLKMRKGYKDGQDVAHELIAQAGGWGAAAVTLHGRSREQRYSRLADWDYIQRCAGVAVEAGGPQLVGNGDVFSFEDHYRALEVNGSGLFLWVGVNVEMYYIFGIIFQISCFYVHMHSNLLNAMYKDKLNIENAANE